MSLWGKDQDVIGHTEHIEAIFFDSAKTMVNELARRSICARRSIRCEVLCWVNATLKSVAKGLELQIYTN